MKPCYVESLKDNVDSESKVQLNLFPEAPKKKRQVKNAVGAVWKVEGKQNFSRKN